MHVSMRMYSYAKYNTTGNPKGAVSLCGHHRDPCLSHVPFALWLGVENSLFLLYYTRESSDLNAVDP